jgi:hypothetical protein
MQQEMADTMYENIKGNITMLKADFDTLEEKNEFFHIKSRKFIIGKCIKSLFISNKIVRIALQYYKLIVLYFFFFAVIFFQ